MNLTNEIIATEVLGWQLRKEWHGQVVIGCDHSMPDFLHDLNSAKLVIDKMREKVLREALEKCAPHEHSDNCKSGDAFSCMCGYSDSKEALKE